MKLPLVFGLICIFPLSSAALSASVYSGCSVPANSSTRHTFYVDPAKGSMTGDGSAAHPWSTLAEVLDPANKLITFTSHGSGFRAGTDLAFHVTNPGAPIGPGDLILLKSGYHGTLRLTNMFNKDFVTVAAAPNETPIIGPTSITSSSKWVFQGVTFEGMSTSITGSTSIALLNNFLVATGNYDWIGQTSQIVFDNDTFRTSSSTEGWTDYDWYNKPFGTALSIRAACVAVTNSHFYNIITAIMTDHPNTLIQGNTLEHFSNDGIDVIASKVLVKGNIIRNGVNKAVDPLHADGIQGWSAVANGQALVNSSVVIDGNLVSKTGDASISYMQGISIFDGKWNNLVVQNNVVNVNHWNGISIWGASYPRVLNNTVIAADPARYPSWIVFHDGKDGTVTKGTMLNNIATWIVSQSAGSNISHNIVVSKLTLPNGTFTSGVVGAANRVAPSVLNGFSTPNVSDGSFDGRITATSVAVGAGVLAGTAPLDKAGQVRTDPVDDGAYNHR